VSRRWIKIEAEPVAEPKRPQQCREESVVC
jgi:hypothetical protein